jgi:hypothetical protein
MKIGGILLILWWTQAQNIQCDTTSGSNKHMTFIGATGDWVHCLLLIARRCNLGSHEVRQYVRDIAYVLKITPDKG